MIKACVFDMGGVVLSFDFTPFYNKVIDYCRAGVTRADLEALADTRHDNLGCGLIPFTDYYAQFCDQFGVTLPLPEFATAWNDIFAEMPATAALIKRLRNVQVLLLSNTDESHIGWVLQRFPETMGLFEEKFYSHEIHQRKPAPEAFQAVKKSTGFVPAEHVLIDDFKENIVAAHQAGWQGVLFKNAEQAEEELKAMGVNITT
jgi:glucose-1-phosphatase